MDGGSVAPETVEEAEKQITRVPLVLGRRNFSWLTERISGVVEQPAPRWWWVAFAITSSIATFGLFCIGYKISTGDFSRCARGACVDGVVYGADP